MVANARLTPTNNQILFESEAGSYEDNPQRIANAHTGGLRIAHYMYRYSKHSASN